MVLWRLLLEAEHLKDRLPASAHQWVSSIACLDPGEAVPHHKDSPHMAVLHLAQDAGILLVALDLVLVVRHHRKAFLQVGALLPHIWVALHHPEDIVVPQEACLRLKAVCLLPCNSKLAGSNRETFLDSFGSFTLAMSVLLTFSPFLYTPLSCFFFFPFISGIWSPFGRISLTRLLPFFFSFLLVNPNCIFGRIYIW
ncbi:hypothetical protein DL96DRAFT_466908 [Flagelloscypha sp. PMI_526]|nr:hypothetical protein DL96DRAFT_466908 [Flagelloscypha sp. PMI_526]